MASSPRTLFAILIVAALLLVLILYVLPLPGFVKGIMAIISIAIAVLGFTTKYYSYIFIPALKMKNRTIVLNENEVFVMSPAQNSIVVRKGEDVYASAFVRIPVYRSATEMNEQERIEFSKMFGRIVTLSKTPAKFCTQLYVINKDAYIAEIRDKVDSFEEKYQSLTGKEPPEEAERIKGEVTMWHNLYDNVNKIKSQNLASYAMVTALGGTEEEATTLAVQQADELASGISAILGLTTYIVQGEELLTFIEPDHMIPFNTISEEATATEAQSV